MAQVVDMNAISWPEMLKRMLFHDPVQKIGVQSNALTNVLTTMIIDKRRYSTHFWHHYRKVVNGVFPELFH